MNMPLGFWEYLLSAITTLGAAFLGAWFAFRLEDNAEHARPLAIKLRRLIEDCSSLFDRSTRYRGFRSRLSIPPENILTGSLQCGHLCT